VEIGAWSQKGKGDGVAGKLEVKGELSSTVVKKATKKTFFGHRSVDALT